MKQRFSSLDIKVIAHELSNSLTSLRVVNVYDLSSRIFLFKFAKPNHRQQVVVDSGFRCHLTSFARTTAAAPSPFVVRLRKYLRTRRVTSVAQIGTDRILEFQFSDGQYRLFLEFYAGGNVVLTDENLKIIALLRNVHEGAPHEHIQLGVQYNLSERQNVNGIPPPSADRVKDGLQRYIERQAAGQQSTSRKLKKKPGDALRKGLASCISEYPPILLDHALRCIGFDMATQPEDVLNNDKLMTEVLRALQEAGAVVASIMAAETAKGYIMGKQSAPGNVVYADYHPFKPKQFEQDEEVTIMEFEGFNAAVDEFYSSIEGQKLESKLQEKEDAAKRKIENARLDQQKRLGALQSVQELNVQKAQAIEANVARVSEATAAINGLIAQGMDWLEVEQLIELEQKRENPVAAAIRLPLKLHENTATLLLGELDLEDDEDDGLGAGNTDSEPSDSEDEAAADKRTKAQDKPAADKRLAIDIDLALSPWANARDYYTQRRSAAAKEEKTLQASTKALKSTQRKVEADLKKALKQEKQVLRPMRQPFWFEKFIYFISSDGYLVLGGRDAQQSELLYKRHMRKGDIFVHVELDGAIPVIVKNNANTPDAPVPPGTLSQAGNLSIATSSAWDSKAVMSAWWANAEQVTKKAETGDVLPIGRFGVSGERNYLPPAQLLLGFAVLFQISDSSKANHTKHRVRQVDAHAGVPSSMESEELTSNSTAGPDLNAQHQADSASEDEDAGVEENPEHTEEDGDQQSDEDVEDARDEEEDEEDTQEPTAYSNPLQTSRHINRSPTESNDGNDLADDEGQQLNTSKTEDPTQAPADEVPGSQSSANSDSDESTAVVNSTAAESPSPEVGSSDLSNAKIKGPIAVRGKKGKRKKIAAKYADQDEADRAEAMRLLGSAAGQQKAKDEALAKAEREKMAAAQRQRRREQHERAQAQKAAIEGDGNADGEDEEMGRTVDLESLVGTPLPGDEIMEAIAVCAPWSALGRYKYKAKIQPGSVKKGKAVREILGKWSADGADKKKVDEKAEDVERIWPREMEMIKGWKEAEVFGVVPVSKLRVMMAGGQGSGGGGKDKKKKQQAKGHSGKGSKKAR